MGVLVIECRTFLIFRAHDPLDRRKVRLAKRIVLITQQTSSSSTMLDRFRPGVHHLAAYERVDPFSAMLSKKQRAVYAMWSSSTINCTGDIGESSCFSARREWAGTKAFDDERGKSRRWFNRFQLCASDSYRQIASKRRPGQIDALTIDQ
jgi:hypothetical protein